ncbi:MAG: ThuA domain-containing protein [Planctomycetota bacterium]
MMNCSTWGIVLCCAASPFAAAFAAENPAASERKPHVVFVVGDHEYRSELTMPELAKELESKYGMRTTLCLAQPDPRNSNEIPGLEALKTADAAVLFMRWRELPEDQLNAIMEYVNKGGPVVAFRTTTHATRYPKNHPLFPRADELGTAVCGQKWITHHGHEASTDVTVIPEKADHPILRGVDKEFHVTSWLYHVEPLPKETEWLLMGKAINSNKVGPKAKGDYPLVQPVAWTWQPKGGRVFYTSLGHPDDFKVESMRRLSINAVHWVLGKDSPDWK